MRLGERIFGLRQKSGQSLQQVADAIGVSKAHVWELEKGRSANPSFELVRKLADHFAVTIDVLVGDDAEPAAEDLQIQRIHRDLGELSERDRDIIEQTIRLMKSGNPEGARR